MGSSGKALAPSTLKHPLNAGPLQVLFSARVSCTWWLLVNATRICDVAPVFERPDDACEVRMKRAVVEHGGEISRERRVGVCG